MRGRGRLPSGVRELVFGTIAIALVVGYGVLGSQAAPVLLPAGTLTPTPTVPRTEVAAPRVAGTIAFTLRGDVFLVRDGRYVDVTTDGHNLSPSLSADGRTVLFTREQTIDGRRVVDGQVTPARLRYTDIVKKDATRGGTESVVLTGLRVRAPSGFHSVAWQDGPSFSPDGRRFAVTTSLDGGGSELEIYDAQTGVRQARLSEGSNLADPAWSPDGRSLVVTSYSLGAPYLLVVSADGARAERQRIDADGEQYRPSYSPDGLWIIYTLRHPRGGNDVHAVEVRTGKDVAITTDGRSWNGVFDPTGGWVAFLRENAGVIDLYAMELSGALTGGASRAPIKLTRGEGIDGQSRPAWGR